MFLGRINRNEPSGCSFPGEYVRVFGVNCWSISSCLGLYNCSTSQHLAVYKQSVVALCELGDWAVLAAWVPSDQSAEFVTLFGSDTRIILYYCCVFIFLILIVVLSINTLNINALLFV